jgi:hypothetical protein
MVRIRRWRNKRGKVVWSEPGLPPWVKMNPKGVSHGPSGHLQPGDISMGAAALEFLEIDERYDDDEQDVV